jgi:hypothetical protein
MHAHLNTRATEPPSAAAAKSREFFLRYAGKVTGMQAGQIARIWIPVPFSNSEQQVTIQKQELPSMGSIDQESKHGNQILYFEARPNEVGDVPFAITFRVKRFEVTVDSAGKPSASDVALYLKPDLKVPVGGKPLTLLEGKNIPSDQLELGRLLYDVVNQHMRYSKEGVGWGQGDAEWACDSKYGNCSDFHSLFISLARSKKIPAKFEMGFPLPETRGKGEITGYHCWAKFQPTGQGWVAVDISEANKNPEMADYYFGNLTEDRVAFSVGRDISLVPKQAGPPLNFFVYPYVEVDGKPYASDKIERKFSFEDIPPAK